MRIYGLLRVKNEAAWIAEVLRSLCFCTEVYVMDDHSTDKTAAIAEECGASVFPSPFGLHDMNEGRDKNWLVDSVDLCADVEYGDWFVMVDGDEVVEAPSRLLATIEREQHVQMLRLPIVYLWDRRDQVRTDGIYGRFRRGSAWRHTPGARFKDGFHCSNVPGLGWSPTGKLIDERLLHYGYMHPTMRRDKYCWYNALDPFNQAEDRYRHIAAGLKVEHADLLKQQVEIRERRGMPKLRAYEMIPPAPAAEARTKHAGPLALCGLSTYVPAGVK